MVWLLYDNADDKTQLFMGCVLIAACVFLMGVAIWIWIEERFKRKK